MWSTIRANCRLSVGSKDLTPLPVRAVAALIDDMERTDGRTQLGTLRVNGTDAGIDHSPMLFHRIQRSGSDHALLVQATMADKERPNVRVEFPLTPGAIEPADLSGYAGVQLEIRGEAECRLVVNAYTNRTIADPWAAKLPVSNEWRTVRVPFSDLQRRAGGAWEARDARALMVELGGSPRSGVWLKSTTSACTAEG